MTIVHPSLRTKIQQTQYYKSLPEIQKKLTIRMQNVIAIGKVLKTIEKVGFDRWDENAYSTFPNREIIKELHTQNLVKNL